MCCSSFLDAVEAGTWLIGGKANALECQQGHQHAQGRCEPTDISILLVTMTRDLPILSTTQITVPLV